MEGKIEPFFEEDCDRGMIQALTILYIRVSRSRISLDSTNMLPHQVLEAMAFLHRRSSKFELRVHPCTHLFNAGLCAFEAVADPAHSRTPHALDVFSFLTTFLAHPEARSGGGRVNAMMGDAGAREFGTEWNMQSASRWNNERNFVRVSKIGDTATSPKEKCRRNTIRSES